MKAILIRLILLAATLGACALGMMILGPWAFMLAEAAPPDSRAAALADLDSDGDLDAFLANGKNESTADNSIWINQGGAQGGPQGQFIASSQKPGKGEFTSINLEDIDNDGDPDVLAGAVYGLKLFINQGGAQGGTAGDLKAYGPGVEPDREWIGYKSPALGDLDGDRDLDIFYGGCCGGVSTYGDNRREWMPAHNTVWMNVGPEKGWPPLFRDSGQRLGTDGCMGAALGDLDGDGDLDAFTANASSIKDAQGKDSSSQPDKVWLNDGTGSFTDSGQRLGSDDGQAVALGDLDGDGDLDALVGSDGPSLMWLNDGAGRFTDSGLRMGQGRTRVVFLGDLDGDGDLDAWIVYDQQAGLWLNNGEGRFSASEERLKLPARRALALGDLDGDGDLDVFAGWLDKDYQTWLNNGRGEFTPGR